ncbi:GNAT family N-acetyltransferase [Microbacterium sp. LTA6]|uniref:GNAT family N-acetyltransferase n=1 Tax=Microbacterium sp. LTA6 TaxID=3129771 RepID=UPI00324D70CB
MVEHVRNVPHDSLSAGDTAELRSLFDREYAAAFGPWEPDAPYGYAPADVHTMVFDGAELVAHVGHQIRTISVGSATVTVAGTGGVLVDATRRGTGLGTRAMEHAQDAMRANPSVSFGYLGCRDEVIAFYEATGWRRIQVVEHCVSWQKPHEIITTRDSPILIYPVHSSLQEWPEGEVDLHGTPW